MTGLRDLRPAFCRFRLQEEGRPYPRSACNACGKTIKTGLGTKCSEPVKWDTIPALRKRYHEDRAALMKRALIFHKGHQTNAAHTIQMDRGRFRQDFKTLIGMTPGEFMKTIDRKAIDP